MNGKEYSEATDKLDKEFSEILANASKSDLCLLSELIAVEHRIKQPARVKREIE